MELRALVLGLTFSLGVFALKNGVGLYYRIAARPVNLMDRLAVPGIYILLYGVLFFLSRWILEAVGLVRHPGVLQHVLHSGMFLHMLLAALLFIWGLLLLRRNHGRPGKSLGWLPLVLPCPVCFLVVFFNLSFLLALFPAISLQVTLLAWLAFVGTGLGTALLLSVFFGRMKTPAETLLGGSMLAIASFFLLSVIFMPRFSEIEEVYRLALHTSREAPGQGLREAALLLAASLAVVGIGFRAGLRKLKPNPGNK